jgi:hypothetical protein
VAHRKTFGVVQRLPVAHRKTFDGAERLPLRRPQGATIPRLFPPVVSLYAFATFLGAALLFLVEPMAAKSLLPVFGGSAGVWVASLVFFQSVLVAGYAYAHLLARRLSLRKTAILHGVVVLVATLLLPWRGHEGFALAGLARLPPTAQVLGALVGSVGAPFFVLAATGPLLQRWFAAPPLGRDPYPLYAVSNASSLAGLLAYPSLFERYLPLAGIPDAEHGLTQHGVWSGAFVVFAAVVLACAANTARAAPAPSDGVVSAVPSERLAPSLATWRARLTWCALGAVPASAMLGTTQALSTDVASVPLLWVLPLAVYLVSFVVAFSGRSGAPTRASSWAAPALVLGVAASQSMAVRTDPRVALPLYLAALFAVGVLCHGRLAARRPPAGDLTGFYLWIAVGGALGTVLAGIVAPLVFRSVVEYPLALVLSCLAVPSAARGAETRAFALARRALPAVLAAAAAALFVVAEARSPMAGYTILSERTFFGVLRVRDAPGLKFRATAGPHAGEETSLPMHGLYHGTTLHGTQVLRPGRPPTPTTYYHPSGPIGRAFDALRADPLRPPLREVGIIGLGVGSLAAYARPGERFTFFEIDPAVVRIARDPALFSFLQECKGTVDVIVRDGRVALQSEPDGKFDLLVVDAFSSDAIPVHLLTREALALDLSKVASEGLVAFHLTSNFFALAPVVAEAAASLGADGLYWDDEEVSVAQLVTAKQPSRWALVARDSAALSSIAGRSAWVPLATQRRAEGERRLWTDRYSSPLSALR